MDKAITTRYCEFVDTFNRDTVGYCRKEADWRLLSAPLFSYQTGTTNQHTYYFCDEHYKHATAKLSRSLL